MTRPPTVGRHKKNREEQEAKSSLFFFFWEFFSLRFSRFSLSFSFSRRDLWLTEDASSFSFCTHPQRKNTAQNNNTENNNNDNKIASSEEEQYFFNEDCHVVPEYVPGELIEANDVNSELYSSVNTGVELFSTTTNTANVYVPSVKSQKGSSFEDFLGEFIGYEETIDDAIVPTF